MSEKIVQTAGREQLGDFAPMFTHVTMYVGWPKGWAVFRLAKEIWNEEEPVLIDKDK